MGVKAFDNRRKLDVTAADGFVEIIDLQRMVGIEIVYHSHSIPLHAISVQQFNALHHLGIRWLTASVFTICVVELLRTINRYAHQPMVVGEEGAPLIIQQRSVGLYAVLDLIAPAGILLL